MSLPEGNIIYSSRKHHSQDVTGTKKSHPHAHTKTHMHVRGREKDRDANMYRVSPKKLHPIFKPYKSRILLISLFTEYVMSYAGKVTS